MLDGEERRQDSQKMQQNMDNQFGMLAEAVKNIIDNIS